MQIVRVKITQSNGDIWYASTPLVKASPEAQVEHLNKRAKQNGVNATYELATEKEYWDYREEVRRVIQLADTRF